MKKLSLEVDELRIERFDIDAPEPARGTVNGAQIALTRRYEETCTPWECYEYSEPGWGTAYAGGPCIRC